MTEKVPWRFWELLAKDDGDLPKKNEPKKPRKVKRKDRKRAG